MLLFGVDFPIWIIIVTLIISLLTYRYGIMPLSYFKSLGIEMPSALLPGIGHYEALTKGIHEFDRKNYNRFKHKRVFGALSFNLKMIFPCDLDLLKKILVKESASFTNRLRLFRTSNPVFQKGLTVIIDDHWKHVRGALTPTFSSGKLRKMSVLINDCCQRLTKNMERKVDTVISPKEVFNSYTMDVVGSTLFGIDVDSENDTDNEFVRKAGDFFKLSFRSPILIIALICPPLLTLLSKLGWGLFPKSSTAFFDNVCQQALDERAKSKDDKYVDFLQLMVRSRVSESECDRKTESFKWSTKGLLNDEIIAQSVLFFLAGFDTTASLLSFAAYNLALNPTEQEKLCEEFEEKIGYDDELTYDNVGKLEYMEMVINETLRLFPPALRFDRICNETTEIDGVLFEKGIDVTVPVYAIHRDPDIWEDPESFKPERFSAENRENMHPCSFIPFGMGPRNCIGMRLAILEAKMALVSVLRKYRFVECAETVRKVDLDVSGLIRPTKPLRVKLVKRNA
ncbi:cytochrome P450 3A9-like [Tubulanus polymorphus]|uniref:cytochrome P450 3A9-like n=1 Tax=Tubulanus polymorphus TaxID=672921 RepID=UPI003DA441D0